MGSKKNQQSRAGVSRLGPQQRAVLAPENLISNTTNREERLASQNARQRQCRLRRANADAISSCLIQSECEAESIDRDRRDDRAVEDKMSDRELRRVSLLIAKSIRSHLSVCPGPLSRKIVLKKALDHKVVVEDLPDHILPSKVALAYKEVVAGVSLKLDLVKRANSAAKLAAKHAILDATVSCQRESSVRQLAKALGIHHRNVHRAINRRDVLSATGQFLFCLTVRRKRTDGLREEERIVIITWWVVETRVSPNKKDVTRKRLAPGVFDEKPTHYLQETQVHRTRWCSVQGLTRGLVKYNSGTERGV